MDNLATPTNLRVLTRDEAAKALGMSRLVLDRLHMDGTGPARVRLSARRVGYRVSDLHAWLEARVEHTSSTKGVVSASAAP